MLTGDRVLLRARRPEDVPVLHAELYDDVVLRSRTDDRPWRPRPVDDRSPFALPAVDDGVDAFSVVELATDELAGACVMWGLDQHNRSAHFGVSLRPAFRGRGLGTDVMGVLCQFAFCTRGLHRVQVETLADNSAMLRSAVHVGFVEEGRMRQAAWVQGEFVDLVVLGQLAAEWSQRSGGAAQA
ncbi:MAG: GNAT family N-acetyltransferase [Actinobacteria bacterium]|nr:GNAT family N-acetyltransferase [Actinomycetota bacterium]